MALEVRADRAASARELSLEVRHHRSVGGRHVGHLLRLVPPRHGQRGRAAASCRADVVDAEDEMGAEEAADEDDDEELRLEEQPQEAAGGGGEDDRPTAAGSDDEEEACDGPYTLEHPHCLQASPRAPSPAASATTQGGDAPESPRADPDSGASPGAVADGAI